MSEENLEPVCQGILAALNEMKREGPTREELDQTLSQIRSELLLSMENTHNRMNNNARNMIYMGRIVTVEEILSELARVTRENVMEYLETYCRPDQMSVVLAGSIEEHGEMKKMIQSL